VEIWQGKLQPPARALREGLESAEGLLCLLTDRIDRELIDGAPQLRAISTYAVGYDNIDLEAAAAREIPVGHTPDVLTDATADFTFALLLAAARRLVEGVDLVRGGEWLTWEPDLLLGADLQGATLGIVGLGRIGKAVARRAEGFGMKLLHTSRSSGAPLDELLAESDFVSLHCPLTEATRHLIDAEALERMKDSAILINSARGELVDVQALERALRKGVIRAAALDVTEPEPLAADHPLYGAPNLLVAPHIASASRRAREQMAELAVDNLLAGLAGEPLPNQVPAGT